MEIGTVTPRPQMGNRKPRIHRLVKENSLLNSLGFPNEGLDAIKKDLKNTAKITCMGINIGPNKDTPIDNMRDDYIKCYEELSEFADFVTINVSSPNTPELRQLQDQKFITEIVSLLVESRNKSKKNPKNLHKAFS